MDNRYVSLQKNKRDFCSLSTRQKRRIVVRSIQQSQLSELYVSNNQNKVREVYSCPEKIEESHNSANLNMVVSEPASTYLNEKTTLGLVLSTENSYKDNIGSPDCLESVVPNHDLLLNHKSEKVSHLNFDENIKNIKEDLQQWVLKHCITHSATSDLLRLLVRNGVKQLPKDVRTLMGTPRSTSSKIITMGTGKYIHFGLADGVRQTLKMINFQPVDRIVKLNLNIDGLPISKSSGGQFWPILAAVVAPEINTKPFPVGIFYGTSKPEDCNIFLGSLVDELLNSNEIEIEGGLLVSVELNAIICDAPAKAFVSAIKSHTGYFACSKCICEGDFVDNRVVYPELNCTLRTNKSFRNRNQPEHHKSSSLLEHLDIDMVEQLPLDYMHLICLGVMKRLLQIWTKGRMDVRLKADAFSFATHYSILLKKYIPREFARYPRRFDDIERWKATEFRLFLLYTGPVILKTILPKKLYEHFLCLSVAIRIVVYYNTHLELNEYANELLMFFAEQFGIIYGKKFLSYNIHNVIYLCNDAKRFGPLDCFSAFKFENYMYKLKRTLKQGSNPLQQIYNRLTEELELGNSCINNNDKKIDSYPLVHCRNGAVKKVEFKEFTLSLNKCDNCCIVNNGKIFMIERIFKNEDHINFAGRYFTNVIPFFTSPCDSAMFKIFEVNMSHMSEKCVISVEDIKKKCLLLELPSNCDIYVTVPLIHNTKN